LQLHWKEIQFLHALWVRVINPVRDQGEAVGGPEQPSVVAEHSS
jgi:hypothetical protein